MERYLCQRLAGDFDLTEKGAFSRLQKIAPETLRENVAGGIARQGTRFRMGYTHSGLYALFEVTDACICAGYTNYNDNLYEQDAVELFISPTGCETDYLEIECNPNGAIFHGRIAKAKGQPPLLYLAPQSHVVCRSSRTEAGWQSLVYIPLSELAPAERLAPRKGKDWLFNAYRVDANDSKIVELCALNPTLCNTFHTPERFLRLEFSD